jgi:ribosomal protein S27AE
MMLRCNDHTLVKNTFYGFRKACWGSADVIPTIEKSPGIYFLGCQTCPNCRETVFAAEGADVTGDAIKYRWTCDLCGFGFVTESPFEEVVA